MQLINSKVYSRGTGLQTIVISIAFDFTFRYISVLNMQLNFPKIAF